MDWEFTFRGLKFREFDPIGVEVLDPKTGLWHGTASAYRRSLERDYAKLPDLAMWDGRRLVGTLRFPQ